MGKTNRRLQNALAYMKKNWFIFFAVFIYALFTVYYMGPALTNCSNTVNGFGDSTAGPIWRYSMEGSSPFTGYEKYTNYPFGESLSSPVDAAVSGQTVLMWAASVPYGPVCGYNVVNAVGYMVTALTMFGFIFTLTRKRWVALLAGYALAFTPYVQVKIGVHMAYGYAGLFVGALWAFLSLIKSPKISTSITMSLLIAACFYFDPYFSLLVTTLLVPFGLVYAAIKIHGWKKKKSGRKTDIKQFKLVGLSMGIAIVLILPLFIIMFTQHDKISSALAGTRNNISEVAKMCSNWPQEYLLPFPDSPLFHLFGTYQGALRNSLYGFSTCGIAEDSVGIALPILIITGTGLLIFLWEKVNKRRLGLKELLHYDPKIVVLGSLTAAVSAFLLALPPFIVHGIPSPSQILITVTSTWRILAREYMVINLVFVMLFSVVLAYLSHQFKTHRIIKTILYCLMFLTIFVQYQTYHPFAGNEPTKFSYNRVPPAYTWLSSQKDVSSVAEYPMEKATESNSLGYYLTMQSVHRKPLFNSVLADSSQDRIHSSIKNLSDPQSTRVLKALGVNTVIIHGAAVNEVASIPNLSIIYVGTHKPSRLPESPSIKKDTLIIARIGNVTPITSSLQFLDNLPYNSTIQTSATTWQYEVPSGTKLIMGYLKDKNNHTEGSQHVCMNVRMSAGSDEGTLRLADAENKKVYFSDSISGEYKRIRAIVPVNKAFVISNNKGYNMRITGIGCE